MRIIIDCDEDEVEISNENTENGYVDLVINTKVLHEGAHATIHPKELMKALQAFL